jgi:hypothetical protein
LPEVWSDRTEARKPSGSVAGVEWKEELDLEKVRLKGECAL